MKKVGIDSISFYVPNIYLSIEELSASRDLEFEKLNKIVFNLSSVSFGGMRDKILSNSDAIMIIGKAGKVTALDFERFIGFQSAGGRIEKKYGIILIK